MKTYELTYLISPDLSEQEAISLSIEISSFIEKEGQGVLEKNQPLLRKQLSYPIKKKTSAYLTSLNFQIKPEKLAELKKQIELNSKILRYLIVIITKAKLKAILSKPAKRYIITKKSKNLRPKKFGS